MEEKPQHLKAVQGEKNVTKFGIRSKKFRRNAANIRGILTPGDSSKVQEVTQEPVEHDNFVKRTGSHRKVRQIRGEGPENIVNLSRQSVTHGSLLGPRPSKARNFDVGPRHVHDRISGPSKVDKGREQLQVAGNSSKKNRQITSNTQQLRPSNRGTENVFNCIPFSKFAGKKTPRGRTFSSFRLLLHRG